MGGVSWGAPGLQLCPQPPLNPPLTHRCPPHPPFLGLLEGPGCGSLGTGATMCLMLPQKGTSGAGVAAGLGDLSGDGCLPPIFLLPLWPLSLSVQNTRHGW